MKTVIVLLNVVFLAFTCLVIFTDGFAAKPVYIVFSLLLIAVPIFTVISLNESAGAGTRRMAGISNLLLTAFIVWAVIDQHPHPAEPGFVPYVVVTVLTPLLSAAVLLLGDLGRPASHPAGGRVLTEQLELLDRPAERSPPPSQAGPQVADLLQALWHVPYREALWVHCSTNDLVPRARAEIGAPAFGRWRKGPRTSRRSHCVRCPRKIRLACRLVELLRELRG